MATSYGEALRFLLHYPLRDSLERLSYDREFAAVVVTTVVIPVAVVLIAAILIAANVDVAQPKVVVAEEEEEEAEGEGGGAGAAGQQASRGARGGAARGKRKAE